MGNSPLPYPTSAYYYDLDFEIVEKSQAGDNHNYSLTVTNTGNLPLFSRNNGYNEFTLYDANDRRITGISKIMNGNLFESQTIGPNQTYTYSFYENALAFNTDDVKKISSVCFSLADTNAVYTAPTVSKVKGEEKTYKIDSKFSKLGDYYYSVVVDAKYDSKDYTFTVRKDNKTFKTTAELDLDKLTIENMTFYRSTYKTSKAGYFFYPFYWVAQNIGYIFLGMVILALIIPPAIIIPIKVSKAKRRKRALENKQK